MGKLQERIAAIRARGRTLTMGWRVRWHWVDHLIRTVQRYQVQFGDRLAGAVTYFAFLSFFPILALAFAVFGYFLTFNPDSLQALDSALRSQLPGLADQLDLDTLKNARVGAGILGLVGLLYAGMGAIAELRAALREMSMTDTPPLNFFLGKLRDLVTLVLVGVTMVASVGIGGFATQATGTVAEFLGVEESVVGTATLWTVGLLASVGADWVLFMIILGWVARPTQPFSVIARGALIGAIGFGVLKQLAALLLGGTLRNPIYGTFAITVGLLLWINFSARLTLYVAAWTATAGQSPPPSPSPIPSNGSSVRQAGGEA